MEVLPDHLVVKVFGAPPLIVTLGEVGLREGGTETSVSEKGRPRSATGGSCLGRKRGPVKAGRRPPVGGSLDGSGHI
jgi:hypothetical protein